MEISLCLSLVKWEVCSCWSILLLWLVIPSDSQLSLNSKLSSVSITPEKVLSGFFTSLSSFRTKQTRIIKEPRLPVHYRVPFLFLNQIYKPLLCWEIINVFTLKFVWSIFSTDFTVIIWTFWSIPMFLSLSSHHLDLLLGSLCLLV